MTDDLPIQIGARNFSKKLTHRLVRLNFENLCSKKRRKSVLLEAPRGKGNK